jgi:hypothetical protein
MLESLGADGLREGSYRATMRRNAAGIEGQGVADFADVFTGKWSDKCHRRSASGGLFTVLRSRSVKEGAMLAN